MSRLEFIGTLSIRGVFVISISPNSPKVLERPSKNGASFNKNRANAKRGLKPKKKHNGYVVLKSEQYEYSHPTSKKNRETLTLWRTTVQSPIDIGIREPEATHLIHNAFKNIFGAKLGFKKMSIKGSLSDNINEIDNDAWSSTLYLLDIKYRQNTRTRLWEVTYIHNWSITIPEDMYA